MKGNANLCRAIVRAGARLGVNNNQGVNIFNYQVATKQLLFRLLGKCYLLGKVFLASASRILQRKELWTFDLDDSISREVELVNFILQSVQGRNTSFCGDCLKTCIMQTIRYYFFLERQT